MSKSMSTETARVIIASGDSRLITRFAEALGEDLLLTFADTWSASVDTLTRIQQDILLLDPGLLPGSPVKSMAETGADFPETRIILIESPAGPELDQVALFKQGVHGFVKSDLSAELLVKAVRAVCNGELWMPRGLITEIIEDLARTRSGETGEKAPPGSKLVECLTPRELEVARMVHQGGNNKIIARTLDISERTVKAHLSAIFRKLNIENRLHLALYFNDVA